MKGLQRFFGRQPALQATAAPASLPACEGGNAGCVLPPSSNEAPERQAQKLDAALPTQPVMAKQSSNRLAGMQLAAAGDAQPAWSIAAAPRSCAALSGTSGSFAGWEAEQQLSDGWGSSRGSSFVSTGSGYGSNGDDSGGHFYVPQLWPPSSSGGRPLRAGPPSSTHMGGTGRLQQARPCSAPGQYHVQYTVCSGAILQGPANCGWTEDQGAEEWPAAAADSPGTASPPQQYAAAAAAAVADGTSWGLTQCTAAATGRAAPQTLEQASSWVPVRYPALATDGTACQGAEEEEEEEEHRSLADEPSAPPLCDEHWAKESSHEVPAAAAAATAPGDAGRGWRVHLANDGPGSGSPWGTIPLAAAQAGGVEAAASNAAAVPTRLRWASESSDAEGSGAAASAEAAAQADSPSRQVSEETFRYQALLESLAARRRQAAAAAAGPAAAGPAAAGPAAATAPDVPCATVDRQLASSSRPERTRPGQPEAAFAPQPSWWKGNAAAAGGASRQTHPDSSWPGSSNDQQAAAGASSQPATHLAAVPVRSQPSTGTSSTGDRSGGSKWAGVQTYLGNLRKAAEGMQGQQQQQLSKTAGPGLGFWEQPVTEDGEALAAAAGAEAGAEVEDGEGEPTGCWGRSGSGTACDAADADAVQQRWSPAATPLPDAGWVRSPSLAACEQGTDAAAATPAGAPMATHHLWPGGAARQLDYTRLSLDCPASSPPKGLSTEFSPLREGARQF